MGRGGGVADRSNLTERNNSWCTNAWYLLVSSDNKLSNRPHLEELHSILSITSIFGLSSLIDYSLDQLQKAITICLCVPLVQSYFQHANRRKIPHPPPPFSQNWLQCVSFQFPPPLPSFRTMLFCCCKQQQRFHDIVNPKQTRMVITKRGDPKWAV